MPEFTNTSEFQQLAVAFKRVRNITRDVTPEETREPEPGRRRGQNQRSGRCWRDHKREPIIEERQIEPNFSQAYTEAAGFEPAVAAFFKDVLVMAEDPQVRRNRRWLLKRLETLMLNLADVSQMVPEERQT
jgi:glycyl-tRNA synthetase beta chain